MSGVVPRSSRIPTPIEVHPTASTREGRRDFASLIATAPTTGTRLPYTHVTDGYRFRDILGSGRLEPTHCRTFNRELLYLFYGRPAYRAAAEAESHAIDAYWPVCLVIRPDAVRPDHVYPFDSGAFARGLYASHMHHGMIKEDFEIEADPESPEQVVRLFWSSDQAYYNADVRAGLVDFKPEPFAFEARSYADLIASTGRAPFEERNSAVEVQLARPLDLRGSVAAVILPASFAAPAVLERIEELGALALPFDVVGRHGPEAMVAKLYDVVRDLLSGRHGRLRCW